MDQLDIVISIKLVPSLIDSGVGDIRPELKGVRGRGTTEIGDDEKGTECLQSGLGLSSENDTSR